MNEQVNSKLCWLWLQSICGAGSAMSEQLINVFGSAKDVYEADEEKYSEYDFITDRLKKKLCDKDLRKAREINAYCENEGIGILTPDSPLYPERLKSIQQSPCVIYYKGSLIDLDCEVCISEVGTRSMTEYGASTAYAMAYDMARAGAVVISGMAKGVDGMAHRGAIDAGGYTVAVLGCGIDRAYPPEHFSLMNEIIKHGAVITEFPPFTPPMGRNFPLRNRIISGLSLGTLVIEAPQKSGALITAETALKQGRDVFAIPGKLGEMSSTGTNSLIRNGAKVATSVQDILLEYQKIYSEKIDLNRISTLRIKPYRALSVAASAEFEDVKKEKKHKKEKAVKEEKSEETADKEYVIPDNAEGIEKEILTALITGSKNCDELAQHSSCGISEVLTALTMLEIEGLITALPGGNYKLNR